MIKSLRNQSASSNFNSIVIECIRDISNDQTRLCPALAHTFNALDARLLAIELAIRIVDIAPVPIARTLAFLAECFRLGAVSRRRGSLASIRPRRESHDGDRVVSNTLRCEK